MRQSQRHTATDFKSVPSSGKGFFRTETVINQLQTGRNCAVSFSMFTGQIRRSAMPL